MIAARLNFRQDEVFVKCVKPRLKNQAAQAQRQFRQWARCWQTAFTVTPSAFLILMFPALRRVKRRGGVEEDCPTGRLHAQVRDFVSLPSRDTSALSPSTAGTPTSVACGTEDSTPELASQKRTQRDRSSDPLSLDHNYYVEIGRVGHLDPQLCLKVETAPSRGQDPLANSNIHPAAFAELQDSQWSDAPGPNPGAAPAALGK